MIFNNVLEAAKNTPLIKLNNMVNDNCADIYVKFEGMNVGGSIKTRTSLKIISEAVKRGEINEESVIVEATSGNQGIGLALVGATLGYKVVIIMPDSVSVERRKIIKQYGAELILVHDEGNIGVCIDKCINTAKKMSEEDDNVFLASQFENYDNVLAHYEGVGNEIVEDLGIVDCFLSGIGTGGTITGISKRLKEVNKDTLIVALEPEHAAILSGGEIGSHIQMGIGDGVLPDILDKNLIDEIMIVKDEDAIRVSKELARKEGILAGISSGTNLYGAMQLAKRIGKGKKVVTILPDTGERYISTELFD